LEHFDEISDRRKRDKSRDQAVILANKIDHMLAGDANFDHLSQVALFLEQAG